MTNQHPKKYICLMAFIFSCVLTSGVQANVSEDLNAFYNSLGYQTNMTAPQSFQDQAAGYYTGGSLFLRNQVRNYQLVSIELPSFSGGCAGIDAFLGSFSVISGAELIKMVKNIMSSAGVYAFDLALATTVPQIKTVKDGLQNYLNKMNQANINSCNMAEDLVGGIWPKTQSAQQQICRDIGSHNGTFTDWAAAREACGTGGKFNEGLGNGGLRRAEVVVNKNLVWDALQQNGLTASDTELAEMLMSLSGSIIIKQKGDGAQKVPLPPMTNNQDIIKALLYGGKAEIYHCLETTKCLDIGLKTINIKTEDGLVTKVTNMIAVLTGAVAQDSGQLTQAERGFLEMTPISVLKYITNSLALGKTINPSEFSELIAISLLDQYLSENIQLVRVAMLQEDSMLSEKMTQRIYKAQRLIALKMQNSYQKLANINVLTNAMRADERRLTSRLVAQSSVGQETA